MKPSPALYKRIRFTTKQVGGGFYRGTGTGAMGAHTEYGGYVIDWRKARHYNVPNLENFLLTPYVSREIEAPKREIRFDEGRRYTPPLVDAKGFLREWRNRNPAEFDHVVTYQREQSESSTLLEDEEEAERESVDSPVGLEAGAEPAKEKERNVTA